MANKHNPLPPLVNESAMDYAQHERTYDGFVTRSPNTVSSSPWPC